jgi:ferritin-like metal-binding protein YciE
MVRRIVGCIDAENHFVKSFPTMDKAITFPDLVISFAEHWQVTLSQIARLRHLALPFQGPRQLGLSP